MRTFSLVLITLCLMSFTTKDKGFLIKGNAKNITDGTMIYLKTLDPNTNAFIAIDSIPLHDQSFEFKGTAEYPTYAMIELGENITELVILEKGNIFFNFDLNDSSYTEITGTPKNTELNTFHSEIKQWQRKAEEYRIKNQDLLTDAIKDNDTEVLEKLSTEFTVFLTHINNIITNQVDNRPHSYISAIVLFQRLDNRNIGVEEAKVLFKQFDQTTLKSNIGQAIQKLIDFNEQETIVKVGEKAPNVQGLNPDEKTISLYDNLGKITILHFWSPWCPACHDTLPTLKKINEQFKDKGLTIFSIALDDDRKGWSQSIKDENLNWNHITDLYEFQMQYGVKTIPTVFVLDQNGVVLDINHLDKNVEQLIQSQLNHH